MWRAWFVITVGCLFQINGLAQTARYESDSFSDIAAIYHQHVTNPTKALLVFDMDDTLMTMTGPLGSVGWWDWQYGLLKNNPDSKQLFASSLQELVKIQGLLFQLTKVEVTETSLAPFLVEASLQGATMLALTARGGDYLSITQNQLQDVGLVDDQKKTIFDTKGLTLANHKSSSAGPFHCDLLKHDLIYYQGVLFISGEDKGLALQCILNASDKKYNRILFVDDSERNVDAVERTFANRSDLHVVVILYTREHAKEAAFLDDEALQTKTYKQWQQLKKAINQNIEHANY